MSHLIFTSDFHEIIRGKITENVVCEINYDPLRIASINKGYIYGSPDFAIAAHIQFHPGENQTIPLVSKTGWLEHPVIKEDGTGSMLTGEFIVPAGTKEITVWITLRNPDGQLCYDSDFGKNFHFRLADEDIQVTKAKIKKSKKTGIGLFEVAVEAAPEIDRITVRYRITNGANPYQENLLDLILAKTKNKTKTWIAEETEVPSAAVLAYDINYYIDGKRFLMENNGNYFIVEPAK